MKPSEMKPIKIPITLPKFVSMHDKLLGIITIPIDPIWVEAGKTYEFVVVEAAGREGR